MNSNITFISICIVIVVVIGLMYGYNYHKYDSVSTLSVITSSSDSNQEVTKYIVSETEPTTTTTEIYTQTSKDTTTSIDTTYNTTLSTTTSEQTTIATTTKKKTTTKSTTSTKTIEFPISLNSITCEELQYINGIGSSTAQKIVDYRNAIGGVYTSRYQLTEIDGIGEKKMNLIMQYTYIENEVLDSPQVQQEATVLETQPPTDAELVQEVPYTEQYSETDIVVQYPINLNTATLEELCTIPTVTPEVAESILQLKDTIQYYSNIRELLYIDGISEEYLYSISEYICVE